METVEIAKTEYDELRARPDRSELEKAEDARVKAEKDLEAAETAQKAAETERDELKVKVQGFEEQGRRVTLRDERIAKLGNGFTAKLGEKTKQRLQAQAGELKDDDWTARLEELEELTGAKRDDGGTTSENADKDDTFTPEEIARHQGGGGGSPSDPTPNQRRSVLAGLSSTRR